MVLSVMTYGKLNMYQNFFITEKEFEHYIEMKERKLINQRALKLYEDTHLQKKAKSPQNTVNQACSLIPAHAFFSGDENGQLASLQKDLLKKLIHHLYSHEKKFSDYLQKNPIILDQVLDALQKYSSKLYQENKPLKTVGAIRNIDLNDHELNDFFYWLTKGVFIKKNVSASEDDSVDNSEEIAENNHMTSFLNFITIRSQYAKIRIYLADSIILSVLFDDPQTVNDILQSRLELYRQAKNTDDTTNLSEQFKQQFLQKVNLAYIDMLDFTVTKTKP